MRTIPIDASRMRCVYIDASPAVAYDSNGEITADQRTDGEGRALWNIGVLVLVEGTPGGETERVRIPHDGAPKIQPMTDVQFDRLVAVPWSQNGRSGVSLMADSIRNGKAPATPQGD